MVELRSFFLFVFYNMQNVGNIAIAYFMLFINFLRRKEHYFYALYLYSIPVKHTE